MGGRVLTLAERGTLCWSELNTLINFNNKKKRKLSGRKLLKSLQKKRVELTC